MSQQPSQLQPLTVNQQALVTEYLKTWDVIGVVARHFAATYSCMLRNGFDTDDIRSLAYVGLVEAASNYDASRGASFATHAFNWIRKHISRACDERMTLKRGGWDVTIRCDPRMWSALKVVDPKTVETYIDEKANKETFQSRLLAALDGIPKGHRDVVLRRFGLDGHEYTGLHSKIAKELGIDKNESVMRLRSAMLYLRMNLTPSSELCNGSV